MDGKFLAGLGIGILGTLVVVTPQGRRMISSGAKNLININQGQAVGGYRNVAKDAECSPVDDEKEEVDSEHT